MAGKALSFHNSQSFSLKVFNKLFPEQVLEGNKISDFTGQTGEVGMPIPFGYGLYPTQGNIIWCSPVRTVVKKKKQGKGGSTVKEYTYFVSYAIAVGRGPIYAFAQIKRNGKLVYAEGDNFTSNPYFNRWIDRGGLYYGTEEQLPDPTIESYEGVGNVSAFRGLAYIVYNNDDVTDTSGAIPQYNFLIQGSPPEVYCTSRPYPNDMDIDSLGMSTAELRSMQLKNLAPIIPPETLGLNTSLTSIELRTLLKNYTNPNPEQLGLTSALTSIELRTLLKNYTQVDTDDVGITAALSSMELKLILQTYTPLPVDTLGLTASLISISLGP